MMIFSGDAWREIAYTIRQNRLRSLLTVFGVFWGIFMLVVLVGAGAGLQNGAYSSFRSHATNTFYLWTRVTTKPYKGFGIGRRYHFTNEDTRILRQSLPEIQVVAPRARMRESNALSNVVYKDKSISVTIFGDEPGIRRINLLKMERGRFLNRPDIEEKRKIAVIGAESVPLLFADGQDPIGEYIRVNGIDFQVVGVFRPPNKNSDDYEEKAKAVFLPLSTFQQTFHWGDVVGWFSINVKPRFDADRVEEKVRAILARRHSIAPNDARAFGSWSLAKTFEKIADLFIGIRFLIWFVGVCTLLAGIMGVSNIMLIVVKERTGEIGIRRAIGASPMSIMRQLIMETLVLTSGPGLLGLSLGVAALELINWLNMFLGVDANMFQHPRIDLHTALAALGVLILGGALAGVAPALRAVRMKPVDALRQEFG
ncbi:MAG: ABC transporter permease [Desulfobacterales bacterium]|nr:ABC transporter permease [Desulfobacterales bacterium]